MVFPGRFSTGCLRCRQRKVKCDETKPSCKRCFTYGKPCTGYTDQFHFRHTRNKSSTATAASSASATVTSTGSDPAQVQQVQQVHSRNQRQDTHRQTSFINTTTHNVKTPSSYSSASSASARYKQRASQSSVSSQSYQSQAQESEQASSSADPGPLALLRAPEANYDQASLCYFVRRFVSPNPDDGFPGHLSFLPGLLYDDTYFQRRQSGVGVGSGDLLETATLSVAQMAAYNRFGGDKFKYQSYRNYGRAIRMLRDAMASQTQGQLPQGPSGRDPADGPEEGKGNEITDDKVVAAILLLCTLKDISGDQSGDPNEHAPGLFYLIERRGSSQLATSRGAELLFLALIRLQVYSFLHENDNYVDPGAIATFWGAMDPLLRAMSMMARTLTLRHKLIKLLASRYGGYNDVPTDNTPIMATPPEPDDPETRAQITEVVNSCFEALHDFHTWDAEAASYWTSIFANRRGSPPPTTLGEVASPGQDYYDVETACTIILIRSARLILLTSMLAYISEDMMGDPELLSLLETEVGLTIHDTLACVPFALGDVPAPPPVPIFPGRAQSRSASFSAATPSLSPYMAAATPTPSVYSAPDTATRQPSPGFHPFSASPEPLSAVGEDGESKGIAHDGAAAVIIVQSIRLVASCAYTTPEQASQAVAVLARLNAGIGIRAAAVNNHGVAPSTPFSWPGTTNTNGTPKLRWEREQMWLRHRRKIKVEEQQQQEHFRRASFAASVASMPTVMTDDGSWGLGGPYDSNTAPSSAVFSPTLDFSSPSPGLTTNSFSPSMSQADVQTPGTTSSW